MSKAAKCGRGEPLPALPALLAGVDEAGRGPLAGPVTAAAVILDPQRPIGGLDDSKHLSARRRADLQQQIRDSALAYAIVHVEVELIDRLNILQASLEAMRQAVLALAIAPAAAWIDGPHCPPGLTCPALGVVGGDARVAAISAASILAKTARDARLLELDTRWPEYGFARHFGYPTAQHLAALARHGACPEHRRSFGPVRAVLESQGAGLHASQPTTAG